MSGDKKLKNQIEAMSATAKAAIGRVQELQKQIEQAKALIPPNTVRIEKKQKDLDELKAILTAALEETLLTLKFSTGGIRSVKRVVNSL